MPVTALAKIAVPCRPAQASSTQQPLKRALLLFLVLAAMPAKAAANWRSCAKGSFAVSAAEAQPHPARAGGQLTFSIHGTPGALPLHHLWHRASDYRLLSSRQPR